MTLWTKMLRAHASSRPGSFRWASRSAETSFMSAAWTASSTSSRSRGYRLRAIVIQWRRKASRTAPRRGSGAPDCAERSTARIASGGPVSTGASKDAPAPRRASRQGRTPRDTFPSPVRLEWQVPLRRLTRARRAPYSFARKMMLFRTLALLAAAAASMAGGPARATTHRAVLCGETVKSSLEAVQAFDFTAVEGETVSITVAATACAAKRCATLGWGLTDSKGRPIPTTGGQLCGGQCEAHLPASDTFTIWVGAIGGPGREFFLSLDAVSATAGGQPNGPPSPSCARTGADGQPDGTRVIDATAPMAGAVSVAGDADTFTFVGAPGDVLRVEVSPTGAAFDPQWQLFDPRGERVLTADGAASCASACDTQSLASAGTFTIEVSDARLDASGAYAIRLARGSTTDTTTSVTLPAITTTTMVTLPAITTTTMVTLPPITTTTTPGPVGLHELAVTLRPPAAAVLSEQMGAALAASGDTILIGAPHDGTAAHDAGLVYAVGVAGGPASPGFGRLLGTLRTPGTPAAGD